MANLNINFEDRKIKILSFVFKNTVILDLKKNSIVNILINFDICHLFFTYIRFGQIYLIYRYKFTTFFFGGGGGVNMTNNGNKQNSIIPNS